LAVLRRSPDGATPKELAEEVDLSIAELKPHLLALAASQKCDLRRGKYRLIPTSETEENLGKRLEVAGEMPIPRTRLFLPPKEPEKEKPKRGRPKQ